MSTTDLGQIKQSLAQKLTSINDTLENVISQYRSLYIQSTQDAMRERLGDFCAELEGLRKTINDPSKKLLIRIESVGKVAQYIDDLVSDVADYKRDAEAHTVENEIIYITDLLGIGREAPSEIEADILSNAENETKNENYFKSQHAELEAIVADHPELKDA